MDNNLKLSLNININSDLFEVWDTLTNPVKIKEYLFGADVITDWQIGSQLIFQGEYQDRTYRDKGIILEFEKNRLLQYSYWSSFSGLEDKPENYSIITFELETIQEHDIIHKKDINNKQVALKLSQSGFDSEETRIHLETNWSNVLEKIKEICERKRN